jgi:hypothetical protein
MIKQDYSLLSDIRKYRDTDKKTQEENYFTDILKWYLNNVDFINEYFMTTIKCVGLANELVLSQSYTIEKYGYMDLFIENDKEVLIIENKVNAPASKEQLQHYVDAIQQRDKLDGKDRVIHVRLITKISKIPFNPEDVIFNNPKSECQFYTWQETYNGLIGSLSSQQKLMPIWMLLDSYFKEEGLLRREIINQVDLKDNAYVRGQAKTMFEDLLGHSSFISLFNEMAIELKTGDFDSNQDIRYQWGRIGVNLKSGKYFDSSKWWPNIFVGCLLDNKDHKFNPTFSGPSVVIMIEWSNRIAKKGNRKKLLESDFYQEVKTFKKKYYGTEQSDIEIYEDLTNKWRFLVIETSIDRFLEKDSINTQDQMFVDYFAFWLNKLMKELHLEKMIEF